MKKNKILFFLLSAAMFFSLLPIPGLAADDPALTSASAVLMDADTGNILFEKDGSRTMDSAAANSLMTALLVCEAIQNQQITSDDDVTAPGDVLYNLMTEGAATLDPAIQPGEIMTVGDLLHAILLRSAGDACNTLAAFISGSASGFVQTMNTRAQELGCADTSFQDTNGQTPGQRTTAQDVARIARAAAAVPALVNVCSSASYTIGVTNMAGERVLANSNQLMSTDSEFYYGEAYGLKAGYSAVDGYCAFASASSDGINAIAIVMGNPDGSARFRDVISLLDWVFDNYSYRVVLSDTEAIDNVAVTLGTTDSIAVRPDNSIRLLLPNDRDLGDVQYVTSYYHEQENRDLIAPVEDGAILGEVSVYIGGQPLGSARLVAAGTSDMSRLEYLRNQVSELLHSEAVHKLIRALVIMLTVYLLLVLFYWFQRVRHLVSLRRAKRARARSLAQQEIAWLDIPEQPDEDASIDYFPPEDQPEDEDPDPYRAPVRSKRFSKIRTPRFRRDTAPPQDLYDDDDYDGDYDDGYYEDEPEGRRIARPENPGTAANDIGQADYDDYDS